MLGPPASEIELEGLLGPYENKMLPIHLLIGPKTLKAYIMTYFSLGKNYNDSCIVFLIVMACFRKKNYNGTKPINPIEGVFS